MFSRQVLRAAISRLPKRLPAATTRTAVRSFATTTTRDYASDASASAAGNVAEKVSSPDMFCRQVSTEKLSGLLFDIQLV